MFADFFVYAFVYLFIVCLLSTLPPGKNQGLCLVHEENE